MSDGLSFAEIDGQHVELLPARTVLSLFSAGGGDGGAGGAGGDGQGGIGVNLLNINVLGKQANIAGSGFGGAGGEQGQDSTCGEQLHVLAVNLDEAQCVRHP